MKSKIFLFAASAIALSACTSEEVVEDVAAQRNAIGFENVANKFSRADDPDLTYGSLKQFHVFGYYTTPSNPNVAVEVFNDLEVNRNADATWNYKDVLGYYRYWIPGARYYFYAYSCGVAGSTDNSLDSANGTFTFDMTNGVTPSNRMLKINNYICDATHQHDLIYAVNTGATDENEFEGILGKETGNAPVGFQFKHLLSKVKAQFTNKLPAGYTARISDVSFENIRNIADYNPNAEGGWQNQLRTAAGQPNVYLLNTDDPEVMPIETADKDHPAVTNSAYVIPFAYSGADATSEAESTWVYLKFTLTLINKNQQVAVKELTGKFNPSWKAGYSYLYNVELTGEGTNFQAIVFTTATDEEGNVVTDWGTGNDTIVIDTDDEEEEEAGN